MFPATTHPADVQHPLDPLAADEIGAATELVRAQYDGTLRFATVELAEPDKATVLAGNLSALERIATIIARDPEQKMTYVGRVSLTHKRVLDWAAVPGEMPMLMRPDYGRAEAAVREHAEWQEAVRRRGVTDLSLTSVSVWGITPDAELDAIGEDDRYVDCITMLHRVAGDNQYARPLEGLLVRVDLDSNTVVGIYDFGVTPLPEFDGNYAAEAISAEGNSPRFPDGVRDDLRPLEVVQRDGASFAIDGHHVKWGSWDLRIGWSPREGIVLYDVQYDDRGTRRPILYRASVSEMVVPYGDTAPMQRLRNAFDVGECGLGLSANSLALGCDCPGETQYLDAVNNSEAGEADIVKNAICLHEEDSGIVWKHSTMDTKDVRRGRRFVISFFTTIGNYDYGFYWYLNLDGSIEFEAKLTGIIATGAFALDTPSPYGGAVAPGLYGPNHQHFFCVRIDPMIDGVDNTVFEWNSRMVTDDPDNARGNAWRVDATPFEKEADAQRKLCFEQQRMWTIANERTTNHVGGPTSYALVPGVNTPPMLAHSSPVLRRAGFVKNHLWVTQYEPSELFAAGEYPHRSRGKDQGLPTFTAANRDVRNTDLVVWYVFGVHHIVRPEDWPVMPVAYAGFELRPWGFFDGNPALNAPLSEPGHCRPDGGANNHGHNNNHDHEA